MTNYISTPLSTLNADLNTIQTNGSQPPGGGTSDRSFKGKVYVNRVYSRVLTAEEIASNYQLDKTRYNLT